MACHQFAIKKLEELSKMNTKHQRISPMQKRIWKDSKRPAQAVCYVYINGKRLQKSLGQWGSQEAQDRYDQLVAELYGNHGITSENIEQHNELSVAFLCCSFYEDAERRVAEPRLKFDKRELQHYETVIKHLVNLYANTPVNKFTASCYRSFRAHLVKIAPETWTIPDGVYVDNAYNRRKGLVGKTKYRKSKLPWTENYVLKLMGYLSQIFYWGVGHDIVDESVVSRFKRVEGLLSDLERKDPRTDVKDETIKKTLPWLTPTVREMVIIQRQNSLRPSEVCGLRVGDIDRTGEIWTATKKGKTTWKTGIPLIIKFCESDRQIIERRIRNKGGDEFVFTPAESQLERWEKQAQERKTKVQPSQQKRAKKNAEHRLERFNPCFSVNGYRLAIQRGIEKARKNGVYIPKWTPYQIRHTAVTVTSYEHDRETAAMLAGHKSLSTTSRYEHKMTQVKEDLARERQAYWTED